MEPKWLSLSWIGDKINPKKKEELDRWQDCGSVDAVKGSEDKVILWMNMKGEGIVGAT